MDGSLKVS